MGMSNKDIKLILSGLDCANCAGKIEKRVNELEEVKEASLNFTTATLSIEAKDDNEKETIIIKAKDIIKKLEPDVKVYEKTKATPKINNSNSCNCSDNSCNEDTNSREGNNHKDNGQSSKVIEEHSHNHKEEYGHNNHHEGHDHNHNEEGHDDHGHSHDHSKGVNFKETLPLIIGALVYIVALLLEKV